MINFSKTILMLALGVLLVISCKKKEEDPEPTSTPVNTKTSLLINKNWKVTGTTVTYGSGEPIDLFLLIEDCEKDDITRFSATNANANNGTYTLDVNVKCEASDANESGLWSFNANQTEIIQEGVTAKIISLSATTF
jgi:hypothetical protein